MAIRKHDKVKILWGKDKGKEGDVIKVEPKKGRVLVAKINLAKRHTRPQGQLESGGIKDKELFMPLAKVMLIDPETKKATRPKFDRLSDGTKIRLNRATGAVIPEAKKR
jgi:large subunit ribosomal protein L24